MRDNDALDVKAIGLLAVDAGAIAVLVAVHGGVNHLWEIPAAVFGIAGLFLLIIAWPRDFDAGPDWRDFYQTYGGGKAEDVERQLLGELLESIEWNDAKARKRKLLTPACLLMLAGLVGSVVVALVG